MENLQECFEISLKKLGLEKLPDSVYGSVPASIRFQIGGEESIYLGHHRRPNCLYIDNGADRAMRIYKKLPAVPDILRIDQCPDLKIGGLPQPDLQTGDSCYWKLEKEPVFLRELFRQIASAEIDPSGMDTLASNVYFLNSTDHLLFQMYDDRGADVAAPDKRLLLFFYKECREWIMESEREKIDLFFQ